MNSYQSFLIIVTNCLHFFFTRNKVIYLNGKGILTFFPFIINPIEHHLTII